MTGKTFTGALALAAGLLAVPLAAAPAAMARDGAVEVLRGLPADPAASLAARKDGTVTIYRGPAVVAPAAAPSPETAPTVFISGQRLAIDDLEPVRDWFLDRSGGELTLVHCFTRHSGIVGGGRRILCDARRF